LEYQTFSNNVLWYIYTHDHFYIVTLLYIVDVYENSEEEGEDGGGDMEVERQASKQALD
jgi:hypothetical protein